jgi:hypothetical protein
MKKSASSAPRGFSAQRKDSKLREINDGVEGTQCTAAYIAELTGELTALANGIRLANLSRLLATAKLEAEYWSQRGR